VLPLPCSIKHHRLSRVIANRNHSTDSYALYDEEMIRGFARRKFVDAQDGAKLDKIRPSESISYFHYNCALHALCDCNEIHIASCRVYASHFLYQERKYQKVKENVHMFGLSLDLLLARSTPPWSSSERLGLPAPCRLPSKARHICGAKCRVQKQETPLCIRRRGS
jgi:hypothetical protein